MLVIGFTEEHKVAIGCVITVHFGGKTFEVERDTPISDILSLITSSLS